MYSSKLYGDLETFKEEMSYTCHLKYIVCSSCVRLKHTSSAIKTLLMFENNFLCLNAKASARLICGLGLAE